MALFEKLFGSSKKKDGSKNAAKERLRFVLIQDQINISPRNMELIKNDLLEVISKYVEIENTEVDVSLENVEGSTAIVASIPVKAKRTR